MIQALAVVSLTFLVSQDGNPDEARFGKLISLLGADFLEEREKARKALEEAGPPAGPALVAALGRPDFRIRKACVELLTAFKDEGAVGRVGEVFRTDEDGSVRDAAFLYLKAVGKPAEDHLVAALKSEAAEHRREAAKILTELRSEKCADRMYALCQDDQDTMVRERAFEYLRTIGKAAEPCLLKILANPDPAARRGALEGLRKVQGDEKTQSDEALAGVARIFAGEGDASTLKAAYDYLRAAGPRAEGSFLEGLLSRQDAIRGFSIEGLRDLKSDQAVDAVARVFLEDASEDVRRQACEFLKSRGLKAEDALVRGLSSEVPKVRLMAIPALGEVKSQKPLQGISSLFREDRDPEVHRAAFDYLKGIGAPAEKDLIHALADPDKQIRLEAIRTLGLVKSQAAIERLIDFMMQIDLEARKAAEDALVRIGKPAVEAVFKAVESGRIRKRFGDAILSLFHQEEVERILGALITREGGSGHFSGMFGDLDSFGKEKAVPVLLRIVTERGYAWRPPASGAGDRGADWPRQMQELAAMALGELGDASVVPPLLEALQGAASGPGDGVHEEIVVALHRLGEKKPYDEFLSRASSQAEGAFKGRNVGDGCAALFQLGLVQGRVGMPKAAEETYLRILRAAGERPLPADEIDCLPTVHYNLACLNAVKGEKAKALEWLRKAVEAGFRDRAWIRMDRDLESLRGEEGYTRLLADDKLFEKKPDE